MTVEPEQYFESLLILVKKEIHLYTKYAVRIREDGGIRHIYNTKLFKEELQNILVDDFEFMDWKSYHREKMILQKEWDTFHETAYQTIQKGNLIPFEYMLRKFRFTEFEKYCVCLAVAPELNREFERMYCYLQDDYKLKYPTLDLCIKMFTMDTLMQKKIIHQVTCRKELLQCIFQVKPEIMGNGLSWKLKLREDLIEYIFFYQSDLLNRNGHYHLVLPDMNQETELNVNLQIERQIEQCIQQETPENKQLLILKGTVGSGRKKQVQLAASAQKRTVLFFDLRELQQKSIEQKKELILVAIVRAVLNQAYLCCCYWETFYNGEVWDHGIIYEILGKASLFFHTIFIITEIDYSPEERPLGIARIQQFEMLLPTILQRIELWKLFLAKQNIDYSISFETLAAQFDFTPGVIEKVVLSAKRKANAKGQEKINVSDIFDACQQRISHRLGERADRVNAAYTWEDLVLEEEQKKLLRQACNQISYQYLVYEKWGFQRKMPYGRGVSMLFSGPPGTGKTMAAQVLARELHLELYKVDLSGILSKYIGEKQKNLKEIFDEVQKSKSILFFDEADALFGKRVSVTDARDISANAQTAYLLQKMEEYNGITILATNLLQNFDDAYKRRIKYMIQFTLPQQEQRRNLWKKVFPEEMPMGEDIDMEYLASNFELSGASIKNIALNAAFLAAAKQEITGMKHIIISLQQEYQKAGKILGKEELKEYYIYKK